MFKQLKFRPGAIKEKTRFAFFPTLVDGGVKTVWLQFYWVLYRQENTYLNWNMPDEFICIGDYSRSGKLAKFLMMKLKNQNIHWASEDVDYLPYVREA